MKFRTNICILFSVSVHVSNIVLIASMFVYVCICMMHNDNSIIKYLFVCIFIHASCVTISKITCNMKCTCSCVHRIQLSTFLCFYLLHNVIYISNLWNTVFMPRKIYPLFKHTMQMLLFMCNSMLMFWNMRIWSLCQV